MGGKSSKDKKKDKGPIVPQIPDGDLPLRLVIVGPTAAGKTSMLITLRTNIFNEEYCPTVLDIYECERESHGRRIAVSIIDTSGDANMGSQRAMLLSGADIIMICVSTDDDKMLHTIHDFSNEAKSACGNTPMVLVGTKTDLRDRNPTGCITTNMLAQQKQSLGL